MSRKNPALCEHSYCRTLSAYVVDFWSRRRDCSYEIHLCEDHARSEGWMTDSVDSVGNWWSVRPLSGSRP
jgi:hypothetical protein